MKLSDEIKAAIDAALKQFGEYSMTDKGAHEVMEIDPWVEKAKSLTVDEVKVVLHEVLNHKFGHYFVTAFLGSIDSEESEWVDGIFADSQISDHY